MSETGNKTGKEFVISRVINAPREMVWNAFTQVDHLKHWWGPKGFQIIGPKLDLRPGGTFLYGMRADNGYEMWGKWTFREIEVPHTLNFISSFADPQGDPVRHPMAPTWPLQMLSHGSFEALGDKTRLTTRVWALDATDEERATFEAGFGSMTQGFGGTWDKLEEYLAKKP